jgi:hypothetical protein
MNMRVRRQLENAVHFGEITNHIATRRYVDGPVEFAGPGALG